MDLRKTFTHSSFRKKLLFLLLVIFLPALGIIVVSGLNLRRDAILEAQRDASMLAQSLAVQQEQFVNSTKTMLSVLAQLHIVQNQDPQACNELFHDLARRYPYYSTITVATPEGIIFASDKPFPPGMNLSDRKHIKDAVRTKDFSVGEYIVGRVSKVNSINFTYPVLNARKKLVAILIAGINFNEYDHFIKRVNLPLGSAVVYTDYKGIRVFRLPENAATVIGKPVAKGYFDAISGQAEEGVFEWKAMDGVTRINAFKRLRLRENLPPHLYIVVGLPKDRILHAANLIMLRNLAILGITLLLALFLAWSFGSFVLIEPIKRLVAATKQFGGGDLEARTGLPHGPDELGRLAQAFDDMATLLETRNLERQRAEEALHKAYAEMEERVQARTAELSASTAALRESEEKYRGLIEITNTGYVILNTEGKVLDANPEYVRLSGYKELKEITGRSVLEWTAEKDHKINEAAVKQCTLEGSVRHLELDYVGQDGRSIPVEINATAISTSEGVKFFSLVRDISERKWIEGEKAKLEAHLLQAQKMEAIGTLAGGIAHDFNNILTAIIGNISLSLMDSQMDGNSRERLAEAENACLQAENLSRQLLTFAKGGGPVKEVVSVNRLITESVSFACRGSKVKYEFSQPDTLWAIEADPGQITQVFQNLVINAIQAMPMGGLIKALGENLEVAAGSELPIETGRYVKISFQDVGIGISADLLPRIFDPFFTTKQMGSGLGLATAYSIIKNHQGHIAVESELGTGSTFMVYLPAIDGKIIQQPKEDNVILSGKGKILVMDDDAMVRQVLGSMLGSLGYQVEFTQDGAQALALYAEARDNGGPFAGVILDLTVPNGMGGKETMERLAKIDPHVKVIVSSGYSNDHIMAEYQRYGFVGVIAKPYKISELGKVLKRSLTEAE